MNLPDDIHSILIQHLQRYPVMQMPDLMKLVYQHVFGGGHLVTDPAASLQQLMDEVHVQMIHVTNGSGFVPDRFEPIGNSLCRLHLAGIEETGIALETVNRFFVRTAERVDGKSQQFRAMLAEARKLMQEHILPFSPTELDTFIDVYDFDSCPPFRHSAAFREAYAPTYRIVHSWYRDCFDVFCWIDTLLRKQPLVRVAIDGHCGSGKSTLASLLKQVYAGEVIHMDHFFLPPGLRTPERLQEIGGNIDYDRFEREVIAGLISGREFPYRVFDCAAMTLGQEIVIKPNRLIIVEGSYSMHAKISKQYDLKVFLKIDPDEQIRRIRQRSPHLLERFVREWIPMENRYFEGMRIAEQSDLLIQLSSGKGDIKNGMVP